MFTGVGSVILQPSTNNLRSFSSGAGSGVIGSNFLLLGSLLCLPFFLAPSQASTEFLISASFVVVAVAVVVGTGLVFQVL